MNVKLSILAIAACFFVLCGAQQKAGKNSSSNFLQNQTTAKVNGSVWYHSGNLLQNPDASSPQVTPPWTQQSSWPWTVTTGPATLGGSSINSPDGTVWFLDTASTFCSGGTTCGTNTTVMLTQTVNVSPGFFHNYVAYITYGGDVFAEGTTSGTGDPLLYHASTGFLASYQVDFLDSSGAAVATDSSGNVLPSAWGCVLGNQTRQNSGYRRTVTAIPGNVTSIRFTASVIDKLSACYSNVTNATFKNGFDNLWLELVHVGPVRAAISFKAGAAPGPSVKATLKRKPAIR